MTVTVREALPADARAFEEIRVAGWKAAYRGLIDDSFLATYDVDDARVAQREEWLAQPRQDEVMLVAEMEGVVVGGAIAGPCRDGDLPGASELWALYVEPGRRRTGIGSALLEPVLSRSSGEVQVLWVLEGNLSGRRFYERHGFAVDGARKTLGLPGQPVDIRYRRARLA